MPTAKIKKLDYKFVLMIIVYAVIIGIAWATSQSSIGVNSNDIKVNTVDIKELKTKSVTSEINTNELYIRMEYMIELQKEMNQTLKAIKK